MMETAFATHRMYTPFLRQSLKSRIAEIRYRLSGSHVSDSPAPGSSFLQQKAAAGSPFAEQRSQLQTLLRKYPMWARGHLRLAELTSLQLSECRRAELVRLQRALEISLQAAEKLGADAAQIKLLQAELHLSRGQHHEALLSAEELISDQELSAGLENRFKRLLSVAIAAALALGESEIAGKLLESIPASRLQFADEMAIAHLRKLSSGLIND